MQTIEKEIKCEDLPGITNVSVSIAVSGVIDNCTEIENMYNKNVLSSELVGISGAPVDITCTQAFDSAKVAFTYDEATLKTSPENLGILWYNEAEQFYEIMESSLDEENHKIVMDTTHFSEYTVVDLNEWFAAWEKKIDYNTAGITAKNNDWGGMVVTAQQLCDEYNSSFGYADKLKLSAILPLSEYGDIYARTGNAEITVSTGEVLEYDCLFLSIYPFDELGFRLSSLSDGSYAFYPLPACGGWTASTLKPVTLLYNIPDYSNGNHWPKYEDILNVNYQFYGKYFMPNGQVDTTDNDNDGLYDIYELTGMRIANGQIIYTKTNNPDSDGDGIEDGEEIVRRDTEIGYFVIKSNPISRDWDYDGICDDIDEKPFSNLICGNLYTEYSKIPTISFNMDYRNFFADNDIYNQALSTASILLSSSVYHENHMDVAQHDDSGNETKVKTKDIKELLTYLGFSGSETYSLENLYTDEHLSEVALGYRKVSYNGEDKTIVAVIIRGTNGTIEEWSSNFYIGNLDDFNSLADWKNIDNHAGFDIAANRIKDIVQMYVNANDLENDNLVYWVTGHSRGVAIANIIGADFEKEGKCAFTYTFAAPNTTLASNTDKYTTIFNVVNADDFVPCLPLEAWGYSRYGKTASVSISDNYEKGWELLTGIFDYNPDNNMYRTIDAMAELISGDPRVKCYKYTCSCHGDGSDNSITIKKIGLTKTEMDKIESKIPYNASPYCEIEKQVNEKGKYDFTLCQTPAYFMQILASVMGGDLIDGAELLADTGGYNLADKYKNAKWAIIGSSFSGVQHPHYVESYYIISKKLNGGSFYENLV